jgi:8-oxo-dGTP pyrophosphatase MutT (NUDIX family)
MKPIAAFLGWLAFWVLWPLLFLYMRGSRRSRVIIIHKDSVLVVKGWIGRNIWQLPGGGLHKREDSLEGAAREVQEELGVQINPGSLQYLQSIAHSLAGIPYRAEYSFVYLQDTPVIHHEWYEIRASTWLPIQHINSKNLTEGDTVASLLASIRAKNLLK